MPTIVPVSDLRNYPDVLKVVDAESPVFLTKNGRGRYVLMDIRDYDRVHAEMRLASELAAGRLSGETEGYIPLDELEAYFDEKAKNAES